MPRRTSCWRSEKSQTLLRNFQGMTTGKQCELIGIGPSAISQLDQAFAQNCKTTAIWRDAVARDFAIERGIRLSSDDRLRRELMQQLYGYGIIDKRALESRFDILFDQYFAEELPRVRILAEEGLVVIDSASIRMTTPLGRLLARVVAAAFDRYLPADACQKRAAGESILESRLGVPEPTADARAANVAIHPGR